MKKLFSLHSCLLAAVAWSALCIPSWAQGNLRTILIVKVKPDQEDNWKAAVKDYVAMVTKAGSDQPIYGVGVANWAGGVRGGVVLGQVERHGGKIMAKVEVCGRGANRNFCSAEWSNREPGNLDRRNAARLDDCLEGDSSDGADQPESRGAGEDGGTQSAVSRSGGAGYQEGWGYRLRIRRGPVRHAQQ